MASFEGLDELRAALKGELLLPQDGAAVWKQSAEAVWAVLPSLPSPPPQPVAVVRPRGTSDVVAAVQFASTHNLPLAVKCGGHGGGNPSWVEGGLLVDMSLMRSVYVDPAARTAVVDGGCQARDVDSETALHGLCVPLGVCSTVGVGGLALNGGLSLLSRAHGAVCDSIVEATLVLADGSVVVVSEASDPELMWALRGAGTALGVVTKLKLRLYEAPAFSGSMVFADDPQHDTYKAVLRWMRDAVIPNPSLGFNVTRAIHPELGPVLVAMVVHTGSEPREEMEATLQPLRDLGPLQDSVGKSSWLETQRTHHPAIVGITAAHPVHFERWAAGHLAADQVTDAFIEEFVRLTADELPLPDCALTLAFIELMGGRLKDGDTPVGFVADAQWVLQASWVDPASHPVGQRFVAAAAEGLARFSDPSSCYINMLEYGGTLSPERAAACVRGAANLERLRAVKARVDPGNMFRHTPHSMVLAAQPAVDV